jgi:hypothetical protein
MKAKAEIAVLALPTAIPLSAVKRRYPAPSNLSATYNYLLNSHYHCDHNSFILSAFTVSLK